MALSTRCLIVSHFERFKLLTHLRAATHAPTTECNTVSARKWAREAELGSMEYQFASVPLRSCCLLATEQRAVAVAAEW